MDKDNVKVLIKRLIDEASVVAPSISRFDEQRNYGCVTDENLDFDSLVSWEVEAKAILNQLSVSNSSVFADLHKNYTEIKEESKEWHSKSILVHRIRQLLIGALTLLDSPLAETITTLKADKPTTFSVKQGYAFIAMPMDSEDHALVDVLEAVKEAANICGVHAERIDEPQSNERITDRILESIQRTEYVIVDLTKSKPNVFFEAGYAHGIGKIPIYFARQGTKIEFDLKDYPVLFFRNLKELKESIEKRIRGLQNLGET
ncbi:MAG: hypothetical protein JRH04_11460 [Deltaproteobacteria bacterium]|nr:hypothetical protein [Deltaproteobacteria bacterium]